MKVTELIFWLAIIIFFTDGGKVIIELIHGPQSNQKIEAPSNSSDPKPSW